MDTKRLDGIHNIGVKPVFDLSEKQFGIDRRRRENQGAERAEREGSWSTNNVVSEGRGRIPQILIIFSFQNSSK